MFGGYQQCVISSTSSHAKKSVAGGGAVRRESPQRGNAGDLLSTHGIQCPVILLLYMCKSFTSCQKPHLSNGVAGKLDSSADKEELYLSTARDKDDNSSVMLWRPDVCVCVCERQ